jgi:hypothetical protein
MATSPTQRSIEYLRKSGWMVDVVEKWIPGANIRRDLFGLWDILAVQDGVTLAVQVTSYGNVSSRIKKITESEVLPMLRQAGWVLKVHGWRKEKNGRWTVREVDIS